MIDFVLAHWPLFVGGGIMAAIGLWCWFGPESDWLSFPEPPWGDDA